MTATHITAPDGSLWQLVPVEPTPEQIEAIAVANGGRLFRAYAEAIYLAGLAAAPEFGGVAVDPLASVKRYSHELVGSHAHWEVRAHEASLGEWCRYSDVWACVSLPLVSTHPPAADEAMGRDVDVSFTADEVNECFDVLIDKGPRLIPEEIIEQMRGYLLEAATHGMTEAEFHSEGGAG